MKKVCSSFHSMKTFIPLLSVCVAALHAQAQLALPSQANAAIDQQPRPTEPSLVSRTPHSRLWQRITWHTNGARIFAKTNRYEEIGFGLYHPGPNGELRESSDQISIL